MNANSRTDRSKKRIAIIGIAIILVAIACIGLYSCAGKINAEEIEAGHAVADAMNGSIEGIDAPDTSIARDANADAEAESEGDAAPTEGIATQGESEHSQDNASKSATTPNSQTVNGSSSNALDSAQGNPQKRWMEDTERVWVVDKEAWTESVPVYGTVEVSICNICGTDITGNTSAHAKEHMKAGEGSGHHSEVRQVITGYDTVSHEEEGHWEARSVGGHWE